MQLITKPTPITAFVLALVLGSVLAGAHVLLVTHPSQGTLGQASNSEVVFITDFADTRRLVGAVDNVFVGRVVAQGETSARNGHVPETLFTVEVLHNIKGTLARTVILSQEGGRITDAASGASELHLVENDPLLIRGNTYLFATKSGGNGKWHKPVPGFGDILIKSDQQRAALVAQFEQATRAQIPFTGPMP
jgi:hypothetical protein